MAINHQYTILCNYISEGQNAQFSCIDIITNLGFAFLPNRRFFHIVVGFTGEAGDRFKIAVEGPDGKVRAILIEGVVEGDIALERTPTKEHGGKRVAIGLFRQPMTDFIFEDEGIYSVVLRDGKKLVNRSSFGVAVSKERKKRKADAANPET